MPINSPTGFLDITNATLRTSNVEAENILINGGNIYVSTDLESNIVLNLENVTNKGNITSNTVRFTNATTGIIATGNVEAAKFIGSGSHLTGIPPTAITGTLSQWSDGTNSDVYITSNVGIGNVHTLTSNTLQVGGNLYVRDTDANVLTVNGNVVASYFEGDGSKLSGIVTDLQGVTDNGNVTTNVVQFSNATTGLVTTANIEVGGDIKVVGLTAGTVPYIASDKFLKDSFITMTGDATVITSNLDVTGNIFMRGNKFIVESETKLINDAIIGIANNNTVSTTDKGIIMQNTTGNVAIIHHGTGDGFADQLTFGYTADPLDTVTVTNDLTKELTVNVLGNVITQNNLSIGGLLKINTISAASSHSLQAVTNLGNVTSNTVQFSNAITSLVASSNIVATGNVSAGRNTDTTSYFGRAAVGCMGTTNQASFAHVDRNSPAQYALKQTAAGPTYINTPASGHIRFTVNDGNSGAEKMRITSAGKVGIGVSAPHANLHVEGNVYVSSNLTVSGNVAVSQNLTVSGTGQTTTSSFDQAGAIGSTLILKDDGSSPGNGGGIMFGASQGYFAAIKGGLDNGSDNTAGRITFFTRPNWSDSTMTSVMTIDYAGTLRTRAHATTISATGGTVSTVDGFNYHTFTTTGSSQSFEITSGGGDVEYLIVAGGGGGGGGNAGGGGGGGGVITGKIANMVIGTHTITVGGGGNGSVAGGTSLEGGTSSFGSLKSVNGGGRGQSQGGAGASTGGSGGGSAGGGGSGTTSTSSGAGRDGQGNRGGNGWYDNYADGGGGGGGASSHGVDATKNQGGNGGGGLAVWGKTYGGGGGGCCYSANISYGGNGGGGNGGRPSSSGVSAISPGAGTNGTGGGGGAGPTGATGGSGIVILRYVV